MEARIRSLKDVLWVFALSGLIAAVFRLWFGLGATTNLSDAFPWGLWKILNMVAGVALATSGFTIGALVYVFRIERFRPYVRPAILVAFLGYGSSCLALLFDIGLPHRFWHPFLMWNEHSFLFEVFWCVMLYFTVTVIEVLPAILERFGADRVRRILHRVSFGVVVLGISLSSLHHSSLGSLFLVTPLRLHGLWYSSLLPLFFILSAMGAGIMLIVGLRISYARFYDPAPVFGTVSFHTPGETCAAATGTVCTARGRDEGVEMDSLGRLALIAVSVLAVYLVLKVADLARTGAWRLVTAGTWESWVYATELLLTAGVPILLVAIRKTRRSPVGLGVAAAAATVGLAMNRLDVGIFGYWRDSKFSYFPSPVEWSLGIGVVAAAGLVFLGIVENFAIFDNNWQRLNASRKQFHATFDTFSRVWNAVLASDLQRVSLIAVFVIPLAWALMYPPYHGAGRDDREVRPPLAVDDARTVLQIDGDRSGVSTLFEHADHQQRLGGEASCAVCHHLSLPGDRSTPCSRCHRDLARPTDIFDHFGHMDAIAAGEPLRGPNAYNRSCEDCHAAGAPRCSASARSCIDCHIKDMWLTAGSVPDSSASLELATGYQQAMHLNCIPCHKEEQLKNPQKAGLADCGACHPGLRPRQLRLVRQ